MGGGKRSRQGQIRKIAIARALERAPEPFALDHLVGAGWREWIGERSAEQPFVPFGIDFTWGERRAQGSGQALLFGFAQLAQLGQPRQLEIGVALHDSLAPSDSAFLRAAIARCSTTSKVATLTPKWSAASSRERSSRTRSRMASA